MTQAVSSEALQDLHNRYQQFKQDNPQQRIRNAADALQVSEVELVALSCGQDKGAQRLQNESGRFRALIGEIRELGSVMALTRNNSVVHEKTAPYGKLGGGEQVGLFLGDIDLRIFFNQWTFGYHVQEGERRSLQFFDAAGTAVHKIYANGDTDMAAFDALVERYLAEDQNAGQLIDPVAAAEADRRVTEPTLSDDEIDVVAFHQDWDQLKDVHDFFDLLKKHQLERQQAFRLAGTERAVPLSSEVFEQALEKAAAAELPVMIFVGNTGMVQIHTGPVKKLMRRGPWFNVLDSGFNLHANTEAFSQAWLVRRPTEDGVVSSLEIFDQDGHLATQMFGARKPGQTELSEWQTLLTELEHS